MHRVLLLLCLSVCTLSLFPVLSPLLMSHSTQAVCLRTPTTHLSLCHLTSVLYAHMLDCCAIFPMLTSSTLSYCFLLPFHRRIPRLAGLSAFEPFSRRPLCVFPCTFSSFPVLARTLPSFSLLSCFPLPPETCIHSAHLFLFCISATRFGGK